MFFCKREKWRKGTAEKDGVTGLRGRDPKGERELEQRSLKEAGQTLNVFLWLGSRVNTSLVSVLGLTQLNFPFP